MCSSKSDKFMRNEEICKECATYLKMLARQDSNRKPLDRQANVKTTRPRRPTQLKAYFILNAVLNLNKIDFMTKYV